MKQQTGLRWRQALVSMAATTLVAVSGCSSFEEVPVHRPAPVDQPAPAPHPAAQVPAVRVGERVQVTWLDGRKESFRVTAVEPDALVGKGVRVPYSDIAVLKVMRANGDRTAIVVSTVAGIVLALVVTEAIFDSADKFGAVAGSP